MKLNKSCLNNLKGDKYMSLLYEGKAKRIFSTGTSDVLRIEYNDVVTGGSGA